MVQRGVRGSSRTGRRGGRLPVRARAVPTAATGPQGRLVLIWSGAAALAALWSLAGTGPAHGRESPRRDMPPQTAALAEPVHPAARQPVRAVAPLQLSQPATAPPPPALDLRMGAEPVRPREASGDSLSGSSSALIGETEIDMGWQLRGDALNFKAEAGGLPFRFDSKLDVGDKTLRMGLAMPF